MITFSGIGIHTGKNCSVEILSSDSGIFFTTPNGRIDARLSFVHDTKLATTLAQHQASIKTVEHLMSAIYALELNDLEIKVYGPEIPILDGSALPYLNALKNFKKFPWPILPIKKPVEIKNGNTRIFAEPQDWLSVTYHVMHQDNILESFEFELTEKNYCEEISPARTFSFLKNIKAMIKNGFGRGIQAGCGFIVADKNEEIRVEGLDIEPSQIFELQNYLIISNEPPRFQNEMARHKILDLLGDLALSGKHIHGKITAWGSGHRENIELVKRLSIN